MLLVQLATGSKHKVVSYVKYSELLMNDFIMHVDLNILPLGSYDLLIGRDWIEKQRVMLNCFEKKIYMHRWYWKPYKSKRNSHESYDKRHLCSTNEKIIS